MVDDTARKCSDKKGRGCDLNKCINAMDELLDAAAEKDQCDDTDGVSHDLYTLQALMVSLQQETFPQFAKDAVQGLGFI